MEELLRLLNVGGDLGIWVLVGLVWRFDRRLTGIEYGLQNHSDMDEAEFKRINHRLEVVEERR